MKAAVARGSEAVTAGTARRPSRGFALKAPVYGTSVAALPRQSIDSAGARSLGPPPTPIHARLEIGPVDDPLEREADSIATAITGHPPPPTGVGGGPQDSTSGAEAVRRFAAPATTPAGHPAAPPIVHEVLRSPGQLLDASARKFFESRFGRDFSDVRLHTDGTAATAAKAIGAEAFTHDNHIAFAAGRYNPQSADGRFLLAHELAHVAQKPAGVPILRRRPKTAGASGGAASKPRQDEYVRLEVFATGMDHAAQLLAASKPSLHGAEKKNIVFIGLHPKFIKVYDQNGKSLGKIALKEVKGLVFTPGVYVEGPKGLLALTINREGKLGAEGGQSVLAQRPFTAEEKAEIAKQAKAAAAAGHEFKQPAMPMLNLKDLTTEPERLRTLVASTPNPLPIYFVPTYDVSSGSGKGGGESKGLYSSPIEGRDDGRPANAPPWPVSVEGPKLVPVDANPTYSAKVDWTANQNYSLASQVISQVGETIHYKWELFDITKYAKAQLAKDPAATKSDPAAKPEKSLEQRIEDFKKSKAGTGTDVTGMGGANREFSRAFEDWWKDTKRASKGTNDPGGDTVREKLSNAAANRLSLELAPVSLLTTAIGAVLKWLADLFAGPRQQQEIPLEKEGIFLVRVITTPAIHEDRAGKPIIRPPSVAARVTEVTPMERAVRESLDEPGAQLAELQSQIDLATKAGNAAKAEYLRSLLAEAKLRFQGSPLTLLTQKRDQKVKELAEFRKNYPHLSDYSRSREVATLNDQIALFEHHQKQLAPGGTLQRVNATLISEVTGEQYPLLISTGPMSKEDGRHRWMLSDVTNRDGDAFVGLGDKPSDAFHSALTKFGGKAAYGRGRIGVRTAGLGLEEGAPREFRVDSAPTDWALAEKRIDDLVTTLAALGLIVVSAGTAAAVIGAGAAAARLIQRWQAGRLYLDAQTVSDVLGVLGGIGAAGQLAAGLRIQKFEKTFAILQEGKATETQIAAAAGALKGAQQLARGVELANEAINYGGLLWGNVSFIDQMMSISDQERSGAITHAAARRARAEAISSAVQNNGLFIAGNVLKAKQQAKAAEKPTGKPAEKQPAPGEKPKPKDVLLEEGAKPAQRPGEPVPIGERRATLAEMKAAVPTDIRELVVVDQALHGDDVRADYRIDPKTGLINEIRLRCGPDARPATVALHVDTVRTMQKYQGFSGRVRLAISWVADLIGVKAGALKPENKKSFEAALEIQKLPKLIEAQMERMRNMEPNARDMAEAELANLENQLDHHLRTLDLSEVGEGEGFVAAKGLSKAVKKQYADLLTKLRREKPGSDPHKKIRRQMYELIGGDLPPAAWEAVYYANQKRAIRASKIEAAVQKEIGWGTLQKEVDVPGGGKRRLDIGEETATTRRAVEVKAYESGKVYATAEILEEATADGKLVRYRGWDIRWRFVDCEPSGPLQTALHNAGITIEIRWSNRPVTVIPPPKK